MNKLAGPLFALMLPLMAVAQDGPKDAPSTDLQIVSLTGELEIEVDGVKTVVLADGKLPTIPAGAKVRVVSGEAVLSGSGVSVKASAGANFTYTATTAGQTVTASFAAAADSTPLQAQVGDSTVTIPPSGTAGVKTTPGAAAVVTAEVGNLTIAKAGEEPTPIKEGGSTAVVTPGAGNARGPGNSTPPPPPPPPPDQPEKDVETVVSSSAP